MATTSLVRTSRALKRNKERTIVKQIPIRLNLRCYFFENKGGCKLVIQKIPKLALMAGKNKEETGT